MAVVYSRVNGQKLERIVALHKDVQRDLDKRSLVMGIKAEHKLSAHRVEGHARIEVEQGDIDRHIILDDERGVFAAMSIEYGRRGDENGKGAMRGLYILHDATGLPR